MGKYNAKKDIIEYSNELNKIWGNGKYSKVIIKNTYTNKIYSKIGLGCIKIYIPRNMIKTTNKNRVDAAKILVGHELAHKIAKGLGRETAPKQFTANTDRQHKESILQCCIEIACDIWGYQRYLENNSLVCGKETLEEFKQAASQHEDEKLDQQKFKRAKQGILQSNLRVWLMNKRLNNQNILSDIVDFYGNAMRIGKVDFHTAYYRSWISSRLSAEYPEIYRLICGNIQ